MMWLAVRSLPALTCVVPEPSMLPTCWCVPETSIPAAALLLLLMFTRLDPLLRAETEPANSSVALLETVAVTAAPIVAEPVVALNRKVLELLTASELAEPRVGAPSTSSVPLPLRKTRNWRCS